MSGCVTVIVPAHNEQASLPATLEPIRVQTVPPADDRGGRRLAGWYGRDGAHSPCRSAAAPANPGSKAKAQNYTLPHCRGDLVLAVDADIVLALDYFW